MLPQESAWAKFGECLVYSPIFFGEKIVYSPNNT